MAAVKRVLWRSCTTERMLKSGISKFEATIRSCRAASGINNSSSKGSSSSRSRGSSSYNSCSSRNFNVNTDCSSSLLIKNVGSSNLRHSAWLHQAPKMEENIFKSPFPDIEIPDVCLSHYVINEMSKYGNAIALVDGITGEELTYAQLQTMIARVGSALARLGIGKGDVITIFSPNCIQYAIMTLAISAIGAVYSPVNPVYTAEELKTTISMVKSRLIVTVPSLLPESRKAQQSCPSVEGIVLLFGDGEGCRPFSSLLQDDMKAFPDNLDIIPEEDVTSIPFSSGTTGLPKGVMLTHKCLVANIAQNRQSNTMNYLTGEDSILVVLPFYHIYGNVMIMLTGLAAGVKLVVLPSFQPKLYLDSVEKYRSTFLHIVPPILLFLSKHPMAEHTDFSSIRSMFVGAAPCSSETIDVWMTKLKRSIDFRQGYGLTEASPLTHCNPPERSKYHSVGPAINNTQYKIVDVLTDQALPSGENGEILIRGPQVMKGYFNNKKATDETITDGWLRTGDIGYADEDGYVVIVDRMKELIKVKGFQVAPAELEALLVSHPAILDAAVIGRPDERLGEAPSAFVVLKPNMALTTDEIHQFVAERAAPYKKLAGGIEFRSEIPKSASGKILRRLLRDQLC